MSDRSRNRDKDLAYKRALYKSEAPGIHQRDFTNRDAATYDPRRDGPLFHASPIAELLGDPLPGRSALDQRGQQPDVRAISLAGQV